MNKKDSSSLLGRLLRKNISAAQLIGYALASIVGLAIVLVAIRFYTDVTAASGDDASIGRDFLIVQRSVNGIGNIFADDDGFTPDDIADLQQQPWVKRLGVFTAADFNVSASMNFGGRGMSTALFFESLPDDFIDITPAQWTFSEKESKFIPIILSKDYLALYNFGFASSRGMPQLSESTMSLLPIRISVSGNGRQQWFDARIVGFSSRLNTIAVPQAFMDWANDVFGENHSLPSRVIIETTSPGDPAIARYLKEHAYELAGDKDAAGRTSYFLRIITGVVSSIGLLISLLSLGILLLSIWLLLYKNRSKTERLMLLGYSPARICNRYYLLIGTINIVVLAFATSAMFLVSTIWEKHLEALSLSGGSPFPAIMAGIIIMLLTTAVSFLAVRRSVIDCFRPRN